MLGIQLDPGSARELDPLPSCHTWLDAASIQLDPGSTGQLDQMLPCHTWLDTDSRDSKGSRIVSESTPLGVTGQHEVKPSGFAEIYVRDPRDLEWTRPWPSSSLASAPCFLLLGLELLRRFGLDWPGAHTEVVCSS